ncbi:MAG: two-component regulator propeller domain-containing protein [Coriobacteriales bacterium]|nr:two-component regulator propeller domain-containing protein [Coriobacteriales bacterium]
MGKAERVAAAITALCVAVSVGGRLLAAWLQLPLWLDSIGIVFVAYLFGPIPGAVAGLAVNTICTLLQHGSFWYGITAIVLGLAVGVLSQRGYLKSFFGAMTTGSVAALASVAFSAPLNILFYNGYTNNMWGDGVIDLLTHYGCPLWLCSFIGQFYLDFVDKVITLSLLFLAVRLMDKMGGRHNRDASGGGGDGTASRALGSKAPGVLTLLVVLLLLAGLPTRAFAASKDGTTDGIDFYSFVQETYSSDNGLPCGEANDIAQTKDGILWIGTYAGLYRYNGREFRLMGDFDSVKNVNCMYVDEEGRLWIGTNDNGLSLCVEEQVSTVIDTQDGLPSNSVRGIVRSSDGTYYVGTSDALQVFRLNAGIKMVRQIAEANYAHSLSADNDGHVAAVTSSGELFVMSNARVQMRTSLVGEEGTGTYTCCLFDDKGRLYVGTSEGVAYVYDISGGSFKVQDKLVFEGLQEINSLTLTKDGIMFGCADNGVGVFVPGGDYTIIHTGEFNNSIDRMIVDYQGNYWFTSSRLGVLKMTRSTFSDLYEMAGISRDVVNSTVMWQDLLYVGTDEGLDIIDLQRGVEVHNDLSSLLEGTRVRCTYVDSQDHLWVCTYGKGLLDVSPDLGVQSFDDKDHAFSDRVRTCVEAKDGTIVASGDTCVARIRDGKVLQTIPYGSSFSSSQVLSFYVMDDGTVLCGTDGDGIVAIRDGKPAWRKTVGDGLTSNIILRIAPAVNAEGLYVVTSNGLCYMEPDKTVRALEAFPYFNNFDVQPGVDGEVLVLSSAGIYVMRETDLIGSVSPLRTDLLDRKFGLGASITANSWNHLDEQGMLYVCTDKGTFRLDTHDYSQAKRSYHMKVPTISLDGVEHHLERGVPFSIAQDTQRMDIDPEVISYTLDDPYVSYQLVGYDAKPTRVRKSELGVISYTNIESGDYTFVLSVLGNDGSVLETSSYQLRKAPMIYDNPWFMAYVFVVAGLAIAWFTWYVARSTVQRRLELQQRELDLAHRQIQMADQTVISIARAVDAKDGNTSQHSHRVSQYSVLLARELGFTEDECENLRKAALLHDIGKIGIPDRILNKPGRLTDEEYAVMKTHVSRGAEILKDFTMIDHVVEGALYHHERYDGSGYVTGIAGQKIPLYGRIIAVADAFDAMTQNRVYRQKQDMGYVLGELERGKGKQFDPEIATIMLRLIDEGKIDHILNGTSLEGEDA